MITESTGLSLKKLVDCAWIYSRLSDKQKSAIEARLVDCTKETLGHLTKDRLVERIKQHADRSVIIICADHGHKDSIVTSLKELGATS